MSRLPAGEPLRFIAVGAVGYGANVGLFAAVYELGAPYGAGSVLAYAFSNALMYVGNRYSRFE